MNKIKSKNGSGLADTTPETRIFNGIDLSHHTEEDLLQLLSILHGELEAQDIYISKLISQLRLSKEIKSRYCVHLQNPFAALVRDDVSCKTKAPDKSKVNVEPIQIFEKIFREFRIQQRKLKQQLLLSRKYQQLVAVELDKERKKNAICESKGISQSEKENYAANLSCEKLKVKQIKTEYKDLLKLCNSDRENYRTIITMLLVDKENLSREVTQLKRETNDSKTSILDGSEIHTSLANQLVKTQNERDHLVDENATLKNRIARLELSLKMHKLQLASKIQISHQRVEEQNKDNPVVPTTGCTTPLKAHLTSPDQRQNDTSSQQIKKRNDAVRVVQGSQDVTLIPSNSHPPIMLAGGASEVTTSGYYSVKPSSDNQAAQSTPNNNWNDNSCNTNNSKSLNKTIVSKPKTLMLSAPSIPPKAHKNLYLNRTAFEPPLSSPNASGAANFALNSPNMPNPPINSPFSVAHDKTSQGITRITSAQFQAVREKFQASSPAGNKSSLNVMKNSSSKKLFESDKSFPNVPSKNNKTSTNESFSKPVLNQKPVPPPKQKALAKSAELHSQPPPLPPKRPLSTNHESVGKHEISRRRPQSAKEQTVTNMVQMKPRRNVSLKRSSNSNNNSDGKNGYPTPPARIQSKGATTRNANIQMNL